MTRPGPAVRRSVFRWRSGRAGLNCPSPARRSPPVRRPGLWCFRCTLMKEKNYDLIPYVNFFGETPENGWAEYWDSPRYGSGYGSVWQTFSFVPETHMLKPYDQRVKATYALMQSFIEFTSRNSAVIKQLRANAREQVKTQEKFPVSWALDKSRFREVLYKGYASGRKTSEVSGLPRLFYDRSKPFEKRIPIYDYYAEKDWVIKPDAYILPRGWWRVVELLQLNKVRMEALKKDKTSEFSRNMRS